MQKHINARMWTYIAAATPLAFLVSVYSPLMVTRRRLFRTRHARGRLFKHASSLDNSVVCWRDKLCSRIHPSAWISNNPWGAEGGNLEPVMHSWFAYDLPHMTRHAMPMATGNQRSMCGQRKYLAGKKRAASGWDCLVTLSLFPCSCHNNVDAQTYSPAASVLPYIHLHIPRAKRDGYILVNVARHVNTSRIIHREALVVQIKDYFSIADIMIQ